MRNTAILCALGALSVSHAFAQQESRQAVITGRPGSPKCTIEVEVDVVADVEIRGTVARLHTLAGSRAIWRRFECNQPMPLNPAGFRFSGVDGRGRQTLIGDPFSSGVAVVRIEDPKAGREGYTFDIEWQGPAGPMNPGPGYQQPAYPQPVPQRPVPQQPPYPQTGYPQGPGGPPPVGDRDHDRDRDRDGNFGADDAVHQCGEQAERQLRTNGYTDTHVTNVKTDQDGRRGDWISGTIVGRRGPNQDSFGFACSLDFQARRVGQVNLRPSNDGYYGPDSDHNRFTRERAIRACGEAVQERLRHDGYADFNIGRIDVADRPGNNNDWIVGGLTAQRGGYSDSFDFSCSVDFDGGRIRSINVNRNLDRR